MIQTAFDGWLAETLDREGPFTMFLILMAREPTTIVPLRSTYLHVIGPDVSWPDLLTLIGDVDVAWDAVAIFAGKATAGGPMPDREARGRLGQLQAAIIKDRMTVRKGQLLDRAGRRLELTHVGH
jgi:hypothetical protein